MSNSPTQPGNIERFTITSNTGGGSIELSAGVIDFRYYESVLSNTVTALHRLLRLVTVTQQGNTGWSSHSWW